MQFSHESWGPFAHAMDVIEVQKLAVWGPELVSDNSKGAWRPNYCNERWAAVFC